MDKIDEIMDELDTDPTQVIEEMDELDKKKKDKDTIYTSFLETDKYIFEQISDNCTDKTTFIKYDKGSDKWDKVNQYKHEGKTYKPITDEVFSKGGVCLPSGVEEYKNTKEIIDQIKSYLRERIQLPVKPIDYEKFLPHIILFYWVYEKFPFIPYIHFVGGTATGKTTAMEMFGDLCYKAVDSTSSLTIASMFRIATQWKGTMMIDEFNNGGDDSKELVTFLKAGVSNRLLYRVEGDTKRELKAYVIKSPKIFTSETPINDAGLQSRTIVIKMERNTRRLPLYMLQEDIEECMHIRNKLLLWRLRNLNKIDLKDIKYGFKELEPFDRRVQQIITPVYYFSDEETKADILEFAVEQQKETQRARQEAIDGILFSILCDLWKSEEAPLKEVCARFNAEQKTRGYKDEFTEKKIANTIRKILGLEIERRGENNTSYIVRNKDVEANRREYYGYGTPNNVSEVSEVSEDIVEIAKEIFNK